MIYGEKKMNDPYIIAEIGVNYYDISKKENISYIEAAKLMIKKAKEAGANAAKFQSYKASKIASKNSPAYWDTSKEPIKSQYELFDKFDKLNEKDYKELSKYCNLIGIDFLSTPFDLDAVDYLSNIVKYYKIASADITNIPLLEKIAKKDKKILLSIGASTIKEIKLALDIIKKVNPKIEVSLLHCVLSYPTLNSNANLNKIKILKEKFPNNEIGYSDHTVPDKNMLILTTAHLFGAKIIEKHFTLDKNLKGNDHYHAMDVEDLKKLKQNLELLNEVLSKNEENYLPCEEIPRKQARRSIVLSKKLKKGEILKEENIIIKRPGTGISPLEYYNIIGKKINKDLEEDSILKKSDIE